MKNIRVECGLVYLNMDSNFGEGTYENGHIKNHKTLIHFDIYSNLPPPSELID